MMFLHNLCLYAPGNSLHTKRVDVLVADGLIAAMGEHLARPQDARVLEMEGAWVSVGFFDPRCHASLQGWEQRERPDTLVAAARAGGYTGLCLMPDARPVLDQAQGVRGLLQSMHSQPLEVMVACALTKGMAGESMAELYDLMQAGAGVCTDNLKTITNPRLLTLALQYARDLKLPLWHFPDEPTLSKGGQMHEGNESVKLGLRGVPALAEHLGVSRDTELALYAQAPLHLGPLSSAYSLRIIEQAREKGAAITAEVGIPHLLADDAHLRSFESIWKARPPYRDAENRLALVKAVQEGRVDALSAMHQPRTVEEKEVEFDHALPGISNLSTAFAVANTALGARGFESLLELLTIRNRKAVGASVPTLAVGEAANLCIVHPGIDWIPKADPSASPNNPWLGKELKGKVLATCFHNHWIMN